MSNAYLVFATFARASGKGRVEPLSESGKEDIAKILDSIKPMDWWGDVGFPRSGPITNSYTAMVARASDAMKLVAALGAWAAKRRTLVAKISFAKDAAEDDKSLGMQMIKPKHLVEVTDDMAEALAVVDEVLAEMAEKPRKRKSSRRPRRKTSKR